MTAPGGQIYKNNNTTGLLATADYWGLTNDGSNLYMGGAGTSGIWKTSIGTWKNPTQVIQSGPYNPTQLITSLNYYNGTIYIAGYVDKAIISINV